MAPLFLLLFSLLLLRVLPTGDSELVYQAPPPVGPDGAYVDCPCLLSLDRGVAQDANRSVSSEWIAEVQAGYGVGECHAWDLNTSWCTSPSPARWCHTRWCYVNPSACNRAVWPSQYDDTVKFSYTACGEVDPCRQLRKCTSSTRAANLPRLGPIYAFANGLHVNGSPKGSVAIERSLLAFASEWLVEMGIDRSSLIYRNLSAASRDAEASTFTACVRDISIGNIDMCLAGGWWDTYERRAIGAYFAGSLFSDDMMLVTWTAEPPLTFFESLQHPLRPFAADLWFAILGVLFFYGFAMVGFEHAHKFADLDMRKNIKKNIMLLASECYMSYTSYIEGAPTYHPKTLSGKVFTLGFGFFLMVTLASFTANMATFLISEHSEPPYVSIDNLLQDGAPICFAPGISSMLEKRYPGISNQVVFSDTLGVEIPQLIRDGRCVAGIISMEILRQHWSNGRFCDLAIVEQNGVRVPVLSIPSGFYVSRELQATGSDALAKKREDGTWSDISSRMMSASRCDSVEFESNQLTIVHMRGNLMLMGVMFLVALVAKAFETWRDNMATKVLHKDIVAVMGGAGWEEQQVEPSRTQSFEGRRSRTSARREAGGDLADDDLGLFQESFKELKSQQTTIHSCILELREQHATLHAAVLPPGHKATRSQSSPSSSAGLGNGCNHVNGALTQSPSPGGVWLGPLPDKGSELGTNSRCTSRSRDPQAPTEFRI